MKKDEFDPEIGDYLIHSSGRSGIIVKFQNYEPYHLDPKTFVTISIDDSEFMDYGYTFCYDVL
jgi:hypothetical protein